MKTNHAVTRNRTWLIATTTQCPNHKDPAEYTTINVSIYKYN